MSHDVDERVIQDGMNDHVTESQLIGGLIKNPASIPTVIATVPTDACTHPIAEAAFNTIMSLYGARGAAPTLSDVRQELITTHRLNPGDVAAWLHTATTEAPLTDDAVIEAGSRVADLHAKRMLHEGITRVAKINGDPASGSLDAIAEAEAVLTALRVGGPANDAVHAGPDVLASALESIGAGPSESPFIKTGSVDLDRVMNGGLEPGRVLVVGARPGGGKSVIGSDLARAALRDNAGVVFVTLEMDGEEVMMRMLSAEGGINSKSLRARNLTEDELHKLSKASSALPWDNLTFIDRPGITVEVLSSLVAHQVAKFRANGIERVLVVVDYVQIMGESRVRRDSSRQQELGHMMVQFKNLARQTKTSVTLLAQVGRGGESRPPTMSDFRESGDIENNTDIAILLHTPSQVDPEDRPGETDFIFGKNRAGESHITVTRTTQFHYSRFKDFAA